MASSGYEIGEVYTRDYTRYYLAVSETELMGRYKRSFKVFEPFKRFEVMRTISVEDLCRNWRISIDELDRITKPYFSGRCKDEGGLAPRTAARRRTNVHLPNRVYRLAL